MKNSLLSNHYILASKSPRRQYLLKELGLNFEVKTKEVDESFPENLNAQQIPLYLCEKKAKAFDEELQENTVVITADTIVWVNNQVLNKPVDYDDAVRMLNLLSGKMHEVYTGVCLRSKSKMKSFYAVTKVYFKKLSEEEIAYYVTNFKPFDKAGAYGAQECLPADVKPCSQEEIVFLNEMGKAYLNAPNNSKESQAGIGFIGVEKIEGSYFNVMGLPLKELYEELLVFL